MPRTLPPQPETITLDTVTYYITDAALVNVKNEHDTIPFEEERGIETNERREQCYFSPSI